MRTVSANRTLREGGAGWGLACYPRMLDSSSVHLQVVVVVREKRTAFRASVCKLNWVENTEEARLLRSGHVDTTSPETLRDHRVHIFVKMKANRPRHPYRLP